MATIHPALKMVSKSATILLWFFNIAMEHGPFLDDKHDELPIKNGDFPELP